MRERIGSHSLIRALKYGLGGERYARSPGEKCRKRSAPREKRHASLELFRRCESCLLVTATQWRGGKLAATIETGRGRLHEVEKAWENLASPLRRTAASFRAQEKSTRRGKVSGSCSLSEIPQTGMPGAGWSDKLHAEGFYTKGDKGRKTGKPERPPLTNAHLAQLNMESRNKLSHTVVWRGVAIS